MPDNLPQLRDIHLPQDITNFPLGYGWIVILCLIFGCWLAYKLIHLALLKSKKLYALKLIKKLACNNVPKSASAMSEILRRICIYKYPEALVLSGNDWIEFLNSKSKTKLKNKTAELLANAPYIPKDSKTYSAENLTDLKSFCLKWIGDNL